jgi:hypothetical protein
MAVPIPVSVLEIASVGQQGIQTGLRQSWEVLHPEHASELTRKAYWLTIRAHSTPTLDPACGAWAAASCGAVAPSPLPPRYTAPQNSSFIIAALRKE